MLLLAVSRAAPVPAGSGSTPALLGADKSASPKRTEPLGIAEPERESCLSAAVVGSELSRLPGAGRLIEF